MFSIVELHISSVEKSEKELTLGQEFLALLL
jgi:hypothetical protein